MSLDAHVVIAARGVDARLTALPGRTLALLGANGSGKSSTLEAIAGILRVDGGGISLNGTSLDGLAARDRRIVLLSQDDALFPTMSVGENIAYGPRSRGVSRHDARGAAHRWLTRVGLEALKDRRPHELSGGQARRVALARALAAEPRVLLLDEPFAGLDVEAASAMRALVREVLNGVTAILTTHDALDAHALADDVAVIESGTVIEHGPVTRVLTAPHTAFAARMAGRVLLAGVMHSGAIALETGLSVPVTAGPGAGHRAAVALRPTEVLVALPGETRDHRLVWWDDAVVAVEPRGDEVRVHGSHLAADVDPARAARLATGDSLSFGVPKGLPAYSL